MKKLFLIIILYSFYSALLAQINFYPQHSGTSNDLKDIQFLDTETGWIVGNNSTVLKTSNGGLSWELIPFKPDSLVLEKIYFVNEDVGFITGKENKSRGSNILFRSDDGGVEWDVVFFTDEFIIKDLLFTNAQTGWLAVVKDTVWGYISRIFKTDDSGASWNLIKEYNPKTDDIAYRIDNIHFVDENTGYALFNLSFDSLGPSYFFRSIDGGLSWAKVSDIDFHLYKLTTIDNVNFWAGGFGFQFSTDSGTNWILDERFQVIIVDMKLYNSSSGYVLGSDLTNGIRFFHVINNGLSIDTIMVQDKNYPAAITSVGQAYIWIVGKGGNIYTNRIELTDVDETTTPINFHLSQNFPNPFNPTTKIKFTLTRPSVTLSYWERDGVRVSLKVYDILGREIATLVNETKPHGTYEAEFDAGELPSGIYFYRLTSANFSQTRKMLLIR